jgi:hypothetical protein
MKKILSAGLLGACLSSAAPISVYFDFTGAFGNGTIGNSMVFQAKTVSGDVPVGLTATVRAYGTGSSTTNTSGSTLLAAALGQYSSGLGVCDGMEQGVKAGFSGTSACSDPHHKVDNINSYNFVSIEFNYVVSSPAYVDLGAVGSDSDISFWWGAGVPATILGANPFTAANRQDQGTIGISLTQLTAASGSATRLLLGASVADSTDRDDSF